MRISLRDIVGSGYDEFWNFRGRYRVVKGGRASKKSTTTALWHIHHLMKHPEANLLVVRKTYASHKDSTYAQLKWAIGRLGVSHVWEAKLSPLEIRYKPTGQKILFRGLDDPMSITSITVDKGYLNYVWFEEAYQITNEDDFNKIDMSIRGDTGGLPKQLTVTLNPWSEKHWIKRRFFDNPQRNALALTTTYQCNEFLGPDDLELFELMKQNNPRRYRIEGLGDWGIAEGAIYDNWHEIEFDKDEVAQRPGVVAVFALDFGYTTDPTALIAAVVDVQSRELWVFDEHYERALTNDRIAEMIKYHGYQKERIIADSSEPKSIDELKRYGIQNVRPANKGQDSVMNGIQFLQQFKMYIHPKCTNTIIELSNYVWSTDRDGSMVNKPIDEYNHLLDALRYACEPLNRGAKTTLIIPGQPVQVHIHGQTTKQVEPQEDDGHTVIVEDIRAPGSLGGAVPVAARNRKASTVPTCSECGQEYTQRRGNNYFCPTHGWTGPAGFTFTSNPTMQDMLNTIPGRKYL
jgi:phage terminase large subunit